MSRFFRNSKGIGYLRITYAELKAYSRIDCLVCDECNRRLKTDEPIILIPYINEAYDEKCGMKCLEEMRLYPEDNAIRIQREEFYKNFYGIAAEESEE